MIIVAPGILRDSVIYMLRNYYRGDFPPRQLKQAMRSWAGRIRDKQGNEFSRLVAQRLRDLGWSAESEIRVTNLLKQGFDEDFGDVDVLAWNPSAHRVLVIECKDVQYRKTYGEIAEQLADFRGELRSDGKPDHLLRHLRRIDAISRHLPGCGARQIDPAAVVDPRTLRREIACSEPLIRKSAECPRRGC